MIAQATLLVLAVGVFPAGVVQKAGEQLTKGAAKTVQEKADPKALAQGAEEMTKGILRGATAETPHLKEAQKELLKGLAAQRKELGKIAHTVAGDATAGVLDQGLSALLEQLGEQGDGPLAQSLAATGERVSAAVVRGATREVHPWMFIIGVALGAFATLVCGVGLAVVILVSSRHRQRAA